MKVGELISELQKWPTDAEVHIDVSASDNHNWEGDRVVRPVAGLRHQGGHYAVAIDAQSYEQMHENKTWLTDYDGDLVPTQ